MAIIDESLVFLDKDFKSKEEVLKTISDLAIERKISDEEILSDLKAREEMFSTAMGFDIAIPHAKTDKIKETSVIIFRNENHITWGDEEVRLIITILTSDSSGNDHLKLLANISRKLVHEETRQKLMNSDDKSEIVNEILNN